MAKGTKALSAPAAVKNEPRGLEGQILTHLRSALHKVSIAGCSFLGPTCGLAITHDLGRPLILSRIEYREHWLPCPWIQHLAFLAMDLEGKPACLEFQLLFPLDPSCGSCTSVYPKLLDLFLFCSQTFPKSFLDRGAKM